MPATSMKDIPSTVRSRSRRRHPEFHARSDHASRSSNQKQSSLDNVVQIEQKSIAAREATRPTHKHRAPSSKSQRTSEPSLCQRMITQHNPLRSTYLHQPFTLSTGLDNVVQMDPHVPNSPAYASLTAFMAPSQLRRICGRKAARRKHHAEATQITHRVAPCESTA